jgi:hypothetical protein
MAIHNIRQDLWLEDRTDVGQSHRGTVVQQHGVKNLLSISVMTHIWGRENFNFMYKYSQNYKLEIFNKQKWLSLETIPMANLACSIAQRQNLRWSSDISSLQHLNTLCTETTSHHLSLPEHTHQPFPSTHVAPLSCDDTWSGMRTKSTRHRATSNTNIHTRVSWRDGIQKPQLMWSEESNWSLIYVDMKHLQPWNTINLPSLYSGFCHRNEKITYRSQYAEVICHFYNLQFNL